MIASGTLVRMYRFRADRELIYTNFKRPPLKSILKNGDLLFENKKKLRWPSLPGLERYCVLAFFRRFAIPVPAVAVSGVTILRSKLGNNVHLRLCLKARSLGPLGPLLLFVIKNKLRTSIFCKGIRAC